MKEENYAETLKQHPKTSTEELKLGLKQVFQTSNDPNHTTKLVTKWPEDEQNRWFGVAKPLIRTTKS